MEHSRSGGDSDFDPVAQLSVIDIGGLRGFGTSAIPVDGLPLPSVVDFFVHGGDDSGREIDVYLQPEGKRILCHQSFKAALTERERLHGLAAIGWLESLLQATAARNPGQQLQSVDEIALPGCVRPE